LDLPRGINYARDGFDEQPTVLGCTDIRGCRKTIIIRMLAALIILAVCGRVWGTRDFDAGEPINVEIKRMESPYQKLAITFDYEEWGQIETWRESIAPFSRRLPEELMPPIVQDMKRRYGNSGVDYTQADASIAAQVLRLLPPDLVDLELPAVEWQIISGDTMLIPHIDENRRSAVNFYVHTHNEKTIFYTNATNRVVLPVINNTIFDPDWISAFDDFTASDGDVYLLNVNAIHSVQDLTALERVTISCGFHLPFDVVLRYFRDVTGP
jgi:hypothetical protein